MYPRPESVKPDAAASLASRGNDRQHYSSHGVPRQSSPPRLLSYQGSDRGLHSLTLEGVAERGIRVNAVAPGPIWTPMIPSTFAPDKVENFGGDVPMKRVGEPLRGCPILCVLASDDSSYMSGQVLHPNGGEIVNG